MNEGSEKALSTFSLATCVLLALSLAVLFTGVLYDIAPDLHWSIYAAAAASGLAYGIKTWFEFRASKRLARRIEELDVRERPSRRIRKSTGLMLLSPLGGIIADCALYWYDPATGWIGYLVVGVVTTIVTYEGALEIEAKRRIADAR